MGFFSIVYVFNGCPVHILIYLTNDIVYTRLFRLAVPFLLFRVILIMYFSCVFCHDIVSFFCNITPFHKYAYVYEMYFVGLYDQEASQSYDLPHYLCICQVQPPLNGD